MGAWGLKFLVASPPDPTSSSWQLSRPPQGCAMAKGCCDYVTGLECSSEHSQVSLNHPGIFQIIFLETISEFCLYIF